MLKILNNNKYFNIVLIALSWNLKELGVLHEIVDSLDPNDTDSVYLLCTAHVDAVLPQRYAVYNFEQLTVSNPSIDVPSLLQRMREAVAVFDYSEANVDYLCTQGITATLLPFGYSPTYEHWVVSRPMSERTVDFSFIGAINERRHRCLNDVCLSYYKYLNRLFISNDCWDTEYSDALSNTKAILNFHYYDGKTILETHRIAEMIANRVLVYTERSDDIYLDRQYALLVNFINKKDMTFLMHTLRNTDPQTLEALAEQRYQTFKTQCNYKDFISAVLDTFIELNQM